MAVAGLGKRLLCVTMKTYAKLGRVCLTTTLELRTSVFTAIYAI
jgi:hypothetical protein